MSHLVGVASLVLEAGGTEAEAIAALLHDAVEDTEITYEELWYYQALRDAMCDRLPEYLARELWAAVERSCTSRISVSRPRPGRTHADR